MIACPLHSTSFHSVIRRQAPEKGQLSPAKQGPIPVLPTRFLERQGSACCSRYPGHYFPASSVALQMHDHTMLQLLWDIRHSRRVRQGPVRWRSSGNDLVRMTACTALTPPGSMLLIPQPYLSSCTPGPVSTASRLAICFRHPMLAYLQAFSERH